MNIKNIIIIKWLVVFIGLSSKGVLAENEVDDFFAMSPAELAAIPVAIATGTPKPIAQSAAVTSVITAEQIKSMGATELHEVLETVPGVHGSLQRSTYDYNYSVRGIQNATNSQLLIMLNGTRITTPFRGTLMSALELPVEAIQRVEVIRGPGSALYGADAFAGVINIITKKAADIKGSKVGGRAGDWDTESAWAQHSAKWAGWDIAGSFQYQHTSGDDGRIIDADQQNIKDDDFGTDASHAPGPMNTRYETYNGHLSLQRKHWDLGFWAFSSIDAGLRAGAGPTLDPEGNTNGEQYLGDVRFSTEDWFEDWELMAHVSYLQANFNAGFNVYPDNARLPITVISNDPNSIGNIDSTLDPLNPNISMATFPDGVKTNLGRLEKIPSIELSSIYQGWINHKLLLSAGFRYEEITTSEYRNFGHGVLTATPPPVIDGTLTDITGT
ncbi:MAG: TonB-dependent receptor plug domain-containing protein, partial [Methylobacter sp.]